MATSKVTYLGDLRTSSIHLQSGSEIISDAPLDNNGKGEAFSPTDTVANGLASCMFTVMGIKARDLDVDFSGSTAEVTKIMGTDPRRITEIHEGDILCFRNAGAYCFSMASNYNSRLKPAEVLWKDGKGHLIRERETFDDILKNQVMIEV